MSACIFILGPAKNTLIKAVDPELSKLRNKYTLPKSEI